MSIRRVAALVAVVPVLACGDATSDWAGTVVDSAGIAVVQNPAEGLWGPEDAWTVVEELSVGMLEGEDVYQFGQIIGVDVDADGNVYIADGQVQDVRVFDATGSYVRTIGSSGSGPGELGLGMQGVFVVGDEVVVPDVGNQRISRFSRSGEFIGSQRMDLLRGVPLRWDMASEGRLVVQRRYLNPADTATGPRGDPITTVAFEGRASDTLAAKGGAPDTVAVLPPGESLQIVGGQVRRRIFEPEPIWDADPDGRLLTARNNAMRFEVWGGDGSLQRVITFPREPKALTERDQQVFIDALTEAARQQGATPQQLELFLQQLSFADHYPAFVSLALGPLESVWAQRFLSGDELAGDEGTFNIQDLGSSTWDVFDAEGRYLGPVTFPGKYQPIRAIGDRFYGIARDELDVQSLKVYRIEMG
jgi:hypothetical protein